MAHCNACQHTAAQLFYTRGRGHEYCVNWPHEGCQVLLIACHSTSPSLSSKLPLKYVTLLVSLWWYLSLKSVVQTLLIPELFFSMKAGYFSNLFGFSRSLLE